MILVVIAALAGPFFLKGPDGRPLMSIGEAMPDWQRLGVVAQHQWSKLTGKARRLAGGDDDGSADGKTRVYKWRDASGNLQYSDEPPPQGGAETLYIDPDVNLIPGTPPPPPAPSPSAAPQSEPKSAPVPEPGLLPPIMDPGRVKQLVDDAQGVQELLDDRARKMDDASDPNR